MQIVLAIKNKKNNNTRFMDNKSKENQTCIFTVNNDLYSFLPTFMRCIGIEVVHINNNNSVFTKLDANIFKKILKSRFSINFLSFQFFNRVSRNGNYFIDIFDSFSTSILIVLYYQLKSKYFLEKNMNFGGYKKQNFVGLKKQK